MVVLLALRACKLHGRENDGDLVARDTKMLFLSASLTLGEHSVFFQCIGGLLPA